MVGTRYITSVMYYCNLPYGEPIYYDGNYEKDDLYDLYIQMIRCNFKLKKNYIPTIQLKNSTAFNPTEYITDSNGEDVTLCLTSVDMELFKAHYRTLRSRQWLAEVSIKATK